MWYIKTVLRYVGNSDVKVYRIQHWPICDAKIAHTGLDFNISNQGTYKHID